MRGDGGATPRTTQATKHHRGHHDEHKSTHRAHGTMKAHSEQHHLGIQHLTKKMRRELEEANVEATMATEQMHQKLSGLLR